MRGHKKKWVLDKYPLSPSKNHEIFENLVLKSRLLVPSVRESEDEMGGFGKDAQKFLKM